MGDCHPSGCPQEGRWPDPHVPATAFKVSQPCWQAESWNLQLQLRKPLIKKKGEGGERKMGKKQKAPERDTVLLTLPKPAMCPRWPPRKLIVPPVHIAAVMGSRRRHRVARVSPSPQPRTSLPTRNPPPGPSATVEPWVPQPGPGARVGMAVAVPEPFVTAGLRFLLALQQRHRDACCRSPHNMFTLISQLPPDSPRCRAPPRRGGRCAPAKPQHAGEPSQGPAMGQARTEGAGQAGSETADKAGSHMG